MSILSKFQKLSGAAAVGAFSLGSAADAATVQPGGTMLSAFDDDRSMEEAAMGPSGPILGQVRVVPSTGDNPESNAQIYAVREDAVKSCMIGNGAFLKEAFETETQKPTPLDSLKFNAPYIEFVENEDRAFGRVQMGFPIENVTLKVGDQQIKGVIEASGYTVKVTEPADVAALKVAYLQGDSIQAIGQSDKGHTMAYSFRNDGTAEKAFEDCLTNLDSINIPMNEYVSIKTTPIEKATPALVNELIGTQCLRGVELEDVKAVHTIDQTTAVILPFPHALEMQDGSIKVADYLTVEPNGDIRVSASLQQSLEDHTVNSCAGTHKAATPPVWTPDVPEVTSLPPIYTGRPPITGGFNPPPLITTLIPPRDGGGCKYDCDGETDKPPTNPAPVPVPPAGVLLMGAIAAAAAMRRLSNAPARAANGPSLEM